MRNSAIPFIVFVCFAFLTLPTQAQQPDGYKKQIFRVSFDEPRPGTLPSGWNQDATAGTNRLATWVVIQDDQAPSPPQVLSITHIHDPSDSVFNLFWTDQIRFKDGLLEAKIRADSGEVDQGGGLIWRALNANNYYIARYNPLERNFRLYYVKAGQRKMLASASANIPSGEWFTLTVSQEGTKITCSLNSQELLHAKDQTFTEAGGVGFWTKADAVSSFDDLSATVKG